MSDSPSVAAELQAVGDRVRERFQSDRRVLSFAEYLELFGTNPDRYARDATRFVRDAFDHYGSEEVRYPWGAYTRWKLFDLPWERQETASPLVGQEHVQEEIYRALSNFAREGKPNRVVLLHGPNGSAKSTIVGCILRALEDFSQCDDGALYRFYWVFPVQNVTRGPLGFGGDGRSSLHASYAHLPPDQLETKIAVELRDHPLHLLPIAERSAFLKRFPFREPPNRWLAEGELSHKSRQIFEALLAAYRGDFLEVLKHVQVERWFVSRRYRAGAVTLGPQLSVDASERQVTMDRSLASLPASLQAVSLYEVRGDLVDAGGGVLEFSDLLKRPLDAFKYLQLAVESQEVPLGAQNIPLNVVMMGSANELHLDAFREHPEFPSFRGRMDLIRSGYLLSWHQEKKIYDAQIAPQVTRHVAPHATELAALFAVLTRMRKPKAPPASLTPGAAKVEDVPTALVAALNELTALEKADLYATGTPPGRFEDDVRKRLRSNLKALFFEWDSDTVYEGRIGASPRELRTVILDAAQHDGYKCLSPLAVLEELEDLSARRAEFEWLQVEPLPGGYHDIPGFLGALRERLLASYVDEAYAASGLIEEASYEDLFDRYVQNVGAWVKKERIRNRITGDYEEPDEAMMREVERLLGARNGAEEFRRHTIATIAAWAIDHPGQKIEPTVVFPDALRAMKEAIFQGLLSKVALIVRDVAILVREGGDGMDTARKAAATAMISRLSDRYGYCPHCAADLASQLVRTRLRDHLPS
jgi:predicted Ser/Thr protein kinase